MEMDFECMPDNIQIIQSTLFGYMAYPNPNDLNKRQQFIAKNFIESFCKKNPHIKSFPADWVYRALDFYDKKLSPKIASSARIELHLKEGSIAGSVLLNMLEMQAAGIEPTVKKAIFITHEFYCQRARSQRGDDANVSDIQKVLRAWSKYKWSAPLYAANQLIGSEVLPIERILEQHSIYFGLINALIERAKELPLRFSCWEFPKGHGFPIVTAETLGMELEKRKKLTEYTADVYKSS